MTDYSAMSDFEINLAVAHIDLCVGGYDYHPEKKEVYRAGMDGGEFLPNAYFNPCNNPADAWPIITANRINVEWHEYKDDTFKPYALSNETMIGYYDESALRAAMIVFLMMKEKGDA